jgi:hypothetical protein
MANVDRSVHTIIALYRPAPQPRPSAGRPEDKYRRVEKNVRMTMDVRQGDKFVGGDFVRLLEDERMVTCGNEARRLGRPSMFAPDPVPEPGPDEPPPPEPLPEPDPDEPNT